MVAKLASAAALALLTAACAATPSTPENVAALGQDATTFDSPGTAPLIKSFTYAPDHADKNGTITFTVEATGATGRTLTYKWYASKGQLTGSDKTATWKPLKADGTVDAGLATIAVTVSDGGGANTPTALLKIADDGTVTAAGGTSAAYTPGKPAVAAE